jgi:hypothetical protein
MSIVGDDPPRGGVIDNGQSQAIYQTIERTPALQTRTTFSYEQPRVLQRKPKEEKQLLHYAIAAAYWRGFAIGGISLLFIGLFMGFGLTNATQILSIPMTKATMEQGAMITKLFQDNTHEN